MFELADMIQVIVITTAGSIIGALVPLALFKTISFNLGKGRYIGGFPLITGLLVLFILRPLYQSPETFMLLAVTTAFAFIGFCHDYWRISRTALFPYQLVLLIIGIVGGLKISFAHSIIDYLLAIFWPLIIIYSLKLSSIVFEMPLILCLGSGVTFLLYFPFQSNISPSLICYTINLLIVPAFLFLFWIVGKRGILGDSGIFSLGFLMAGMSISGKSSTLLALALIGPSMVLVYPTILICFLITSSYLANELYLKNPQNRQPNYSWTLKREKLVVFSGLFFLCLNFGALLAIVNAGWFGYSALFLLFGVSFYSFTQTYAKRSYTGIGIHGKKINILGVKIDSLTKIEVLEKIRTWISSENGFRHVVTADTLAIVRARREKSFNSVVSRADLILPDGAGLIWAADFLGTPLKERIPGVSLTSDLCVESEKNKWGVFFLGSRPGVGEKAAAVLKERFPSLQITGIHHGYFREGSKTESEAMDLIKQASPKILFVAMGVPRQEFFINQIRRLLSNTVAIGIGGSLDVISGNLPRAPSFMQRFGLEWLFRLLKEPSRFSRMKRIPEFVIEVIRSKWNTP